MAAEAAREALARRPDEQVTRAARQPVRQPAARPPAGDLYCPECGTGNARSRALCERCGAPLALAADAPRLPWWRRRPPGYQAGARPARRSWRRPRVSVPIVLAALLVAAVLGRGSLGRAVDYVRDQASTPRAVQPNAATASSSAAGHPAAAAFDGATNRCWMPTAAGSATGQHLDATFAPPVRLLKVVVFAGCSPDKDVFVRQGRPRQLTLDIDAADGTRTTATIELADQPGQQTFTVRAPDVAAVRITVTAAYQVPRGAHVAIAEVEFYRR
jgi:hypothetical protein